MVRSKRALWIDDEDRERNRRMLSPSFDWHRFFLRSAPKEIPRSLRRWAERNIDPDDSNIREAFEKIGGPNLWRALDFCLSVARDKGPTKRDILDIAGDLMNVADKMILTGFSEYENWGRKIALFAHNELDRWRRMDAKYFFPGTSQNKGRPPNEKKLYLVAVLTDNFRDVFGLSMYEVTSSLINATLGTESNAETIRRAYRTIRKNGMKIIPSGQQGPQKVPSRKADKPAMLDLSKRIERRYFWHHADLGLTKPNRAFPPHRT